MSNVFNLFTRKRVEPEPVPAEEPEFDMEDELLHLTGHIDDFLRVKSPGEGKVILARIVEVVADWPDDD